MSGIKGFLFIFFICSFHLATAQIDSDFPSPDLSLIEQESSLDNYSFTIEERDGTSFLTFVKSNFIGKIPIKINGEKVNLQFNQGTAQHSFSTDLKGKLIFIQSDNSLQLFHVAKKKNKQYRIKNIPLWLSLIPPLVAIILALVFKEVLASLFMGIWAGAFIAGGLRLDSIYYFFLSWIDVIQKYITNALADRDHVYMIIFTLLIGGMVGIISRNGGMAGIVKVLSKYARSRRSAQFITWLMGIAIFFDDYSNTLIVGNTMRPLTDSFKISREKLAYIVDSTAAPVVSIAFITTWIGAELSYIESGVSQLENYTGPNSPYAIFIYSLKYSFYPILALSFLLMLIYFKKDFGPMYEAELRAHTTGKTSLPKSTHVSEAKTEDLSALPGAPHKWQNGVFPILVVIIMTILGLMETGMENSFYALQEKGNIVSDYTWSTTWQNIGLLSNGNNSFFTKVGILIGNSNSFIALIWASISGVVVALMMTLSGKIMDLPTAIQAMIAGFKIMFSGILILALAWALALITKDLHTAQFLSYSLQDSLNPLWMPGLIFILAALIAFSTGSSWSTMAILYPIAIPTTWGMCMAQGVETELSLELLYNVVSIVLAASVLGDHCSPISDTTILSSLSSDCPHIDHVKTQLPYAITVGVISLLAGILTTALGGGIWICLVLFIVSLIIMILIIRRFGKTIPIDR